MNNLDRLYSPWRSSYLFSSKGEKCVFCLISEDGSLDAENKVFYRDEICIAVMNLYPYTPGHFMIVPHKHVDSPSKLSSDDWQHLHKMSQKAVIMLESYGANGINMGINIRRSGGAGIPEHLHIHFVPRYDGDTNFMTSISGTRVYGTDFDAVYNKISELSLKYFKGVD